ncbi:MAG: DUF1015 family protein [Bacteroidetes bacterium]|nr:DUF1015 family protein [Bacteroidota bacterium]
MAIIKPFAALRPSRDKAGIVSSTSYDSNSRELSLNEVQNNPYSYLHVVKSYLHFKGEKKNPEKHFPLGLEYLQKFKDEGTLIKDKKPLYYIYRLIKGSKAYTGLIASASVDDYLNNVILKHENTLTEKQNELAEHISFFNGLGNPILLTYPDNTVIESIINKTINSGAPEYNFLSADQLKHNLWLIHHDEDIDVIEKEFKNIEKIYIADGHHRTAGSATYCQQMRDKNPSYNGSELHNYFPVFLIPFNKLHIFEYHRLVRDKAIVNAPDFLKRVGEYFDIIKSGHIPVQPLNKAEFGLYFNHNAYLIKLKPEIAITLQGSLDNLDVSIVEEFLLKKVFNILDSKTDKRLSFMDGSKGILTLENIIDSGDFDIAITLYPTSIEEVKQIADENLIMPPKSTWIEPKIRTGLVIYETI